MDMNLALGLPRRFQAFYGAACFSISFYVTLFLGDFFSILHIYYILVVYTIHVGICSLMGMGFPVDF